MENRFTAKEQTARRKSFIEDCMQKAWGAACHAAWIEKNINELIARYKTLQAEDKGLEDATKVLADALDYHTTENRSKRADLQKQRNAIDKTMKLIATNTQQGAVSMQKLLDSVDQNLLLAEHAKGWEWKENPDHVLEVTSTEQTPVK